MTRFSKKWVLQAVSWLGNEKPVFLMQFDSLKDDLTHVLKEAVTFLELNTTSELLECTASNTEGSYHREKTHSMEQLLVFPHNYTVVIEHYKDVAQWYLRRRCPEPPLCIPYSEVNLTGRPDIWKSKHYDSYFKDLTFHHLQSLLFVQCLDTVCYDCVNSRKSSICCVLTV